MLQKIKQGATKTGIWLKKNVLALTATASCAVAAITGNVLADGAQEMLKVALKIIGKICIVPAAIFTITGIIQYASAHADGDGPATKKAIAMISAGIMIAAVAILLSIPGVQDTFANLFDLAW